MKIKRDKHDKKLYLHFGKMIKREMGFSEK